MMAMSNQYQKADILFYITNISIRDGVLENVLRLEDVLEDTF